MSPGAEHDAAEAVVGLLRAARESVATAESLTGGLVCAALVDVPGASAVVRGGVVAYAADLKIALLRVDVDVVERHGTVHAATARAMAEGARQVAGADWSVATTGVAGPDPSEGRPVGTVHVAVAGPDGVTDEALDLSGDRTQVRLGTVGAALSQLRARLVARAGEDPAGSGC